MCLSKSIFIRWSKSKTRIYRNEEFDGKSREILRDKETAINQVLLTETVLYVCLKSCKCLSQDAFLFAFYSSVIFTTEKLKIWNCMHVHIAGKMLRCSVGTNPWRQWSSADTPQLNVCSNMSPDHSCEEAAFCYLTTNAYSCLVMASQCRSRCHRGTLCASAQASSVNPFISTTMVRLLQCSRQEFSGILTGLSTYRHKRGVKECCVLPEFRSSATSWG